MTAQGFVVSNDKFVKLRDELGTVNLAGNEARFKEADIRAAVQTQQFAALDIPEELIIRSLPVNVELMDLIREQATCRDARPATVNSVSKFLQIDQLSPQDARLYLSELRQIFDEDISISLHPKIEEQDRSLSLEGLGKALTTQRKDEKDQVKAVQLRKTNEETPQKHKQLLQK